MSETRLDRTADQMDPVQAGIGKQIEDFQFRSIQSEALSIGKLVSNHAGLVIFMTSADCPISRKYAPRASAIEKEFGGKLAFLYVNVVDAETPDDMRELIRKFDIRAPYASDVTGDIRRKLEPATTTETFLLNADRKLVYRGALDDQYRIGGAAAKIEHPYLWDAIVALLAGRNPSIQATKAPGCLVDPPEQMLLTTPSNTEELEFYPRIADILEKNCTACHCRGGAAPFSLEFPDAVRGRASMIEAVIRDGLMPPTHHLQQRTGAVIADRTIPAADRDSLINWLHSSRQTGKAPPKRSNYAAANSWQIGPPDLILTSAAQTIPADGPLQHTRQLLPLNNSNDHWLGSIECRPVMQGSIETALVWMVLPGGILPQPEAMPPSEGLLTTFSPGDSVRRFESGTGLRLPAGTLLIVDSYSLPMGRTTTNSLRIAMRFARDVPRTEIRIRLLSARPFEVAPGQKEKIEASMNFDEDVTIIALQPILRTRGRDVAIELQPPGEARPDEILKLDRYDSRWLIRYPLKAPLRVTKGLRLTVRGTIDNTSANPANPDPRAIVRSGAGAADELLLAVVETVK